MRRIFIELLHLCMLLSVSSRDNALQCIFQMTITWTSGYGINEAEPFVEWGLQSGNQKLSPAGTLTFDRTSMCGV